jgi:hypothetical protein
MGHLRAAPAPPGCVRRDGDHHQRRRLRRLGAAESDRATWVVWLRYGNIGTADLLRQFARAWLSISTNGSETSRHAAAGTMSREHPDGGQLTRQAAAELCDHPTCLQMLKPCTIP